MLANYLHTSATTAVRKLEGEPCLVAKLIMQSRLLSIKVVHNDYTTMKLFASCIEAVAC
jgi:hypothetical protein